MPPDDRQYSENEVQQLLEAALKKQKEMLNNAPPQNPQNNPPNDSVYSGAQQFIQAAQGIENVKKYFRSPVVEAIETSMSTLISSSLDRSLQSMQNPPQAQQEPKSFAKTLAEIAVHNMSQQVPQILQVAQDILGADRVKKGYDTGLQYFEQQNERQNIPSIVAQLDPNEPEHIKYYAELMGIPDFELAQNKLIDHINSLSRGGAQAQPPPQEPGQPQEYYDYEDQQPHAQQQARGEPEVSRIYHEPPQEKKPKKQVIQEAEIVESYEPEPEPEERRFTQTSNSAFWTGPGMEPEPEPEENRFTQNTSTGFYAGPGMEIEPEPEPEIYRVKPKGIKKAKLKRSGGN